MRLRVGAATDRGRVRDRNEDAYLLRAAEGLFVVCDGMGGAPAGEVASQLAIDAIARDLREGADAAASTDDRLYLAHTTRLAEAVRRSNALIYERAQKEPGHAGMGTTLVGAWIRQHVASVVHVGDSRAYLWHADRLEPLTRDHSLPDQQHVLVRVLGREPHVDVDLKEAPVQAGDYVLLCSDGLTRMVPDRGLAHAIGTLREPQRICDGLIDAANRNGGADNITVVVVNVAGSPWRRLWERLERVSQTRA
jgi:protein phosphatase